MNHCFGEWLLLTAFTMNLCEDMHIECPLCSLYIIYTSKAMVAAWRLRSTTLASLGTRKRDREKEEDVNKDSEEQVINVHVRKKKSTSIHKAICKQSQLIFTFHFPQNPWDLDRLVDSLKRSSSSNFPLSFLAQFTSKSKNSLEVSESQAVTLEDL